MSIQGRTWKTITTGEKQLICEMYDSGYTAKDIAEKLKRAQSTINITLVKCGRTPLTASKTKKDTKTELVKKQLNAVTVSLNQKKDTKTGLEKRLVKRRLNALQQSLHSSEIHLLKISKSSNEFIEQYFQQFGFGIRSATTLRDFWTKRKEIIEYESQKYAVKPAKKVITEKADEEVGSTPSVETLIGRTNNLLAECIQLHKEMINIALNQYQHFINIQKRYEKVQEPTVTKADK